jgi:sarcosine oxidase gamma subunit
VLLDVTGPAALELMRMGALHDFEAVSDTASSATLFAGQRVIVARIPHGWRLHVERPNAAAIWQWLQRAASAWAKPPADASDRSQSPQLHATQQVAS